MAAPNELNGSFNPHEVNLLSIVDFKKGCYIGQEVIARLNTYDKVQKRLTGIKFIDEPEYNGQLLLFDKENKDAGQVTSVTFSKELNKWVGLAFVRRAYLEEGTILTAKSEKDKPVRIQVESLPFKK